MLAEPVELPQEIRFSRPGIPRFLDLKRMLNDSGAEMFGAGLGGGDFRASGSEILGF